MITWDSLTAANVTAYLDRMRAICDEAAAITQLPVHLYYPTEPWESAIAAETPRPPGKPDPGRDCPACTCPRRGHDGWGCGCGCSLSVALLTPNLFAAAIERRPAGPQEASHG